MIETTYIFTRIVDIFFNHGYEFDLWAKLIGSVVIKIGLKKWVMR